jgi:hypothetical protein
VTGWVCEKFAQTIFLSKLMHNLNRGEKVSPKIWAYSVIKKLPKDNNEPMGEKWPTLVTLLSAVTGYADGNGCRRRFRSKWED